MDNLKGPIEYIKEAFRIYTKKENFIFFAKIMAVLTILTTSVAFVSGYFYPSTYLQNGDFSNIPMLIGFVLISVVSIIAGVWSQTTIYVSIIKMDSSILGIEKEVLRTGFKKIIRFLVISTTLSLIIGFGAILLIIPAFIFGVWYSFSTFLVLDKEMSVGEALRTSKMMVKGKFWKVLGRSAVFGLITFIISLLLALIPYAGSIILSFIAPLFLLPYYLMYRDLSTTV